MKTTKFKALLFFTVILLTACADEDGYRPCIRGNDDIETENRPLADFSKINYQMEGSLEVRHGDEHRIEIEGSSNQLDHVKSKVENGRLRIYSERCLKNADFHFIVYTPGLEELKLSGSGSAHIAQKYDAEEMNFELSGSGELSAPNVSAKKISARISGSGDMELGGDCMDFDLQLSGSGKVAAFSLTTNNTDVHISGSGGADIFVTNRLDASISGSGSIRYKGSPATVNTNTSGSGKVTRVQ